MALNINIITAASLKAKEVATEEYVDGAVSNVSVDDTTWQTKVQEANVASGLGSTVGVALTSEADIFSGSNGDILTQWKDTVSKMNRIQPPTF